MEIKYFLLHWKHNVLADKSDELQNADPLVW